MAEQEEGEYELVMQFVLVKSHGGEFDDASFVAGFVCGGLSRELAMTASVHALPHERYMDVRHLEGVDLIAMDHGYQIFLGDTDDSGQWQLVEFGWADTEPPTEGGS